MSSLEYRFSVSLDAGIVIDGKEISQGKLEYNGLVDPAAAMAASIEHLPKLAPLVIRYVGAIKEMMADVESSIKTANENKPAETSPAKAEGK